MTHPSCPKHQAMATIEIRGQLRPGVCRGLCQEQGVPVAVGPQDGGRHFTWEQAALCLWLPWSEAGDAGPQTQGRGRRAATPQLSLVRTDTQSVWSAHTGLSPGSPTVLVFWCPGQPRENRVRPSAAFCFPECSCHQQDQTLSSGPLPS